MDDFEILQRVGLAAAIGLLIGIERGWQARQARDGSRVAGIRTFTLIGGLGGICGLLPGTITLGLCIAGFAIPFGVFEWQRAKERGNYSATGFIAGLMTFALGAYAARGSMVVAAAGGVVVAAILAERQIMHSFLRRLKWTELRAALVLLAMTVVLLPALPDRTVDPWNALNPHQIWLMTVLVGAVSYAGYIAVQVAGERRGLLFAAIAGGLVTSTTVTWTFARLVKRNPALLPDVMAAILAAWIVSLLRMTTIAIMIAPSLLAPLGTPIGAASILLLIPAALAYRAAGKADAQGLSLQDPIELPLMLRFTALVAAIMLLSKILSSGPAGLFALGGLTGLLDVDPITLSMAQLTGTQITPAVAAATILIAAAANGLAKSVLAVTFGGLRLGLALSAMALLAFCAGAAVIFSAG
ncbi:MAG TPA: DUF4010 domain-containing protein [Rhizomicrobium sp.]|nr:DUF4010 domain-containing protein [Rhizomicrobium sp.]